MILKIEPESIGELVEQIAARLPKATEPRRWGVLLSTRDAREYLGGMSETTFRKFASENGIRQVRPTEGCVRWKRADLDRWASVS